MSTVKRLISGSAASWVRIAVTMVTQLALVPVYLSHWSVELYGVWIAIQALVNILTTLDRGFLDYLEYEFLKIGTNNRKETGDYLWSGLLVILIAGIIEMLVITAFSLSPILISFLNEGKSESQELWTQAGYVLVMQCISWFFCYNITGLFFRALSAFGYFPRLSWWNVAVSTVASVAPVLAVINGASLLTAGIWATMGMIIITVPQYFDIYKLLKKECIPNTKGRLKIGMQNYIKSLALSGRYFLENFRQQGVRLILAPLSGAAGLASFATMRTGANVALQGLTTITNPLMPELMRFLNQKAQQKTEAAFGTVWLVLVGGLAPAVVLLQAIAPPLFTIWTKGQIDFNPLLFASLSLGVLVYALAQPAIAVVVGNNLLKSQMIVSIASSLTVLCSLLILVPLLNMLGAGIGLLIAEIIAAAGFRKYAKKWLEQNSLYWPSEPAKIASISVWVSASGMLLMIYLPAIKYVVLILTVVTLFWNVRRYWKNMPRIAKDKVASISARLFFLKKLKLAVH
ncbi:hypothetical protein FC093_11285 [Ilyomonas limi]|uniref:Polysaccharide biosynthesis protein C-terminal domain-containing protein n=1 Tax=Ilyomonas limi TaxID=2575867 RepID=A0A4U3L0F5_9BACT|nr:hypothetical protein [Ilyomonas limi]TKK68212.1 hypothetical protein FC093_11285 [Ilyomonas limi]